MFYFDKNPSKQKHNYSKRLDYSESIFRSASIPILWLDKHGDVRWNHAAQYEILNYLLEKQYPFLVHDVLEFVVFEKIEE